MKVILDEGMPLRAAAALREAGIEASHILELGMGGATDREVLDKARGDGAVVATLDADFHQILASTGADRPSVIRVRIESLQGRQMAILLLAVLKQSRSEIEAGAALSVGSKSVRLRRLPIKR
jgi:predicted nuclease of predicted toxin-antitoxin system